MDTTLIGAIAAVITATAVLIGALTQFLKVLQEFHLQLNSRMDQLVEGVRLAAHAQGVAEQQANPTKPTGL